jgi:amino acid transporter
MDYTFTQLLAGYGGLIWMSTSFPLYILYILWRNNWKVLHSVSDSWYKLKQHERHEEIFFTIFTYFLGIGTLLQYYLHPIFFLAGMGFFWVGTQTQFRGESIKETIHYLGAVLGIGGSLIGLGLTFSWIPLLIMLGGVGIMKLLKINNFLWWVEILAFILVIGGLWVH